jgi:hypothetical protein
MEGTILQRYQNEQIKKDRQYHCTICAFCVSHQSNMAVIAGIYEHKQIIVPLETRNLNPNVFFLVEYNIQ